jgi:hypothetical protein
VRIVLFDFLPEPQHGPGKVISDDHCQGLADAWAKHYDHPLVLQPFNMKRDAAPLDAVQFIEELQFSVVHGSGAVHNRCLAASDLHPVWPPVEAVS